MKTEIPYIRLQFLTFWLTLYCTQLCQAQIRIDYSAASNGLVIPISDTATLTNPIKGVLILNVSDSTLYVYDGTQFNKVSYHGHISNLSDADNDTKVEVMKNGDEDIIRFSTSGTEKFAIIGDRFQINNADDNHFIGTNVGQNHTLGTGNTFYGSESGETMQAGYSNTFIGRRTGQDADDADDNTFIGHEAGSSNTDGDDNTFVGSWTGESHVKGGDNVGVGSHALGSDSIGMRNTAIGTVSMNANKIGTYNTAVGYGSLRSLRSGEQNVAFGTRSMGMKTSGKQNIAIGGYAGQNNLMGNNNIFIGFDAGRTEMGNEKLYIDGSSNGSSTPLIYGDFDSDSLQINGSLNVFGKTVFNPALTNSDIIIEHKLDGTTYEPYIHPSLNNWGYLGDENFYFYKTYSNFFYASSTANYQTFSDRRLKTNIEKINSGLYIIEQLNPVSYQLIQKESTNKSGKADSQYGLIAQEVQKVLPQIVEAHPSGNLSVGYQALIPFLIKSIQELSAEKHRTERNVAELQQLVENLNDKLVALTKTLDKK